MLIRHEIPYIEYQNNLLITIHKFYELYEKESKLITQLESKFRHRLNQIYNKIDANQSKLVQNISQQFYSVFAEQLYLLRHLWNLLDMNNIMIKDKYNNYVPLWTETYIKYMDILKRH